MPYGDCSLSKSLDNGGHRPLNSAAPATSMAVAKARVPRFSRLRIRERGMRELPRDRCHALTMTRREAEACRGFLDVFSAVPSKRLCGFHGYSNYLLTPAASVWRTRRVGAGEWKTARKDSPSPSRAVCLFAPQYHRLSFNFRACAQKALNERIVIFTNLFKNRLEIRMKSAFQSLIV